MLGITGLLRCVVPADQAVWARHGMVRSAQLHESSAQVSARLSPSNKFSYYFTNALGGRVYISAFNEEGFQVTAAGLLDLATGETVSPEGLGSDETESNVTIFNGDVTVNGLLTANGL